jgi:hypothetical protein
VGRAKGNAMKKNKKFYLLPNNISEMTDEEIEALSKSLYKKIVQVLKQTPPK